MYVKGNNKMKFNEYKIKEERLGFQWIEDDILVGDKESPCANCGSPTKYIEICSEAHFCSDECVEEFYRQFEEALRKYEEIFADEM